MESISPSPLSIAPADLDDPDVVALLGQHLAFAHAVTPDGHVHALDRSALRAQGIEFFGARSGGELVAVAALRAIGPDHVELKSMHTARAARGRGIGNALLRHLMALARARGHARMSLETGTMEAFAPARRLYERAGFERCRPFADYAENEFSVCMTRAL